MEGSGASQFRPVAARRASHESHAVGTYGRARTRRDSGMRPRSLLSVLLVARKNLGPVATCNLQDGPFLPVAAATIPRQPPMKSARFGSSILLSPEVTLILLTSIKSARLERAAYPKPSRRVAT